MINYRSYTHNLSSCEIINKSLKKKYSGLNGIRTHDLCDTNAVLYQLSYQTICEFVKYPYKVKDANEYMKVDT